MQFNKNFSYVPVSQLNKIVKRNEKPAIKQSIQVNPFPEIDSQMGQSERTSNCLKNFLASRDNLKDLSQDLKLINDVSQSFRKSNMIISRDSKSSSIVIYSQQQILNSVKIIQKFWRGYKARKSLLKLKKQWKYRKNVIQELLTTEQNYLNHIKIMKDNIKSVMQTFVKEYQINQIFSNISSIVQLHENLNYELKRACQQLNSNTQISIPLLQYCPYFKIYFTYFCEFEQSQQTIAQLQKENDQVKQFFINMKKQKEFNGLSIEDYLVKPIQRLPKYILLLKDLIRNTPSDNIDYNGLNKALYNIQIVNDDNDQNLSKINKNQKKLFELHQQFEEFIPNIQLVESTREFISEEVINIFKKHEYVPAVLYILSDLIIVTERDLNQNNMKYLTYIELDPYSKVRDIMDSEINKNAFKVIGTNDQIEISASNQEEKIKLMNLFNKNIKNIKEKLEKLEKLILNHVNSEKQIHQNIMAKKYTQSSQFPLNQIQVKVLGTELRKQTLKTYTVYIIEVSICELIQKIFVRFKEIKEIQKILQSKFPSIVMPYLQMDVFFMENQSKVVEQRKLQIEKYIKFLLKQPTIASQSQQILQILGLPIDFYELPFICKNQNVLLQNEISAKSRIQEQSQRINQSILKSDSQASLTNNSLLNFPSYRETIDQKSIICKTQNDESDSNEYQLNSAYNSTDMQLRTSTLLSRKVSAQRLIRSNMLNNCLSQQQLTKKEFSSNEKEPEVYEEVIVQFPNNEQFQKKITPQILGIDLLEEASEYIKIANHYDYKLVIVEENEERILQDDEILFKTLGNHKNSNSDKKSTIGQLKRNLMSLIQKKIIYFKKCMFLPDIHEQLEYSNDLVRLNLLSYQFFNELKKGKYNLYQKEWILFSALYLCIRQSQHLESLEEIIPKNYLKQYQNKQVFSQIIQVCNDMKLEVKKVKSQELQQFKENNICQLILMKYTCQLPLYGSFQFKCTIEKDELCNWKYYQQQIKNTSNIQTSHYISINYKGIMLTTINYQILIEIQLQQINDIKVGVNQLIIFVQTYQNLHNLKLNAINPLQILELINEYREILPEIRMSLNQEIENRQLKQSETQNYH